MGHVQVLKSMVVMMTRHCHILFDCQGLSFRGIMPVIPPSLTTPGVPHSQTRTSSYWRHKKYYMHFQSIRISPSYTGRFKLLYKEIVLCLKLYALAVLLAVLIDSHFWAPLKVLIELSHLHWLPYEFTSPWSSHEVPLAPLRSSFGSFKIVTSSHNQ